MSQGKAVPEGMGGVIAHLTIKGCAQAMEWYDETARIKTY